MNRMGRRHDFLHWLLLLALSLSLTACGFHLRGQARIPERMNHTAIMGVSPGSALARALTADLRANGVWIVSSPTRATAVLRIVSWTTHRNVLALTSTGQVAEYQLRMRVTFTVHAMQGHWHISKQTLEIQRQYAYSNSLVLGVNNEARRLQRGMVQELANLIVLRLQTYARRN